MKFESVPVHGRPILFQVVEQAERQTGLVDDGGVQLGRVAWSQGGLGGLIAAVLLSIRDTKHNAIKRSSRSPQ